MGIRFYIEEIMSMEQDHYPLQQQKLKVYVIKKVREMETETEMQHQRSGEYLEYWKAPKSIELSLKQTTMVYQKSFDEANKRELVDRLKNTLEQQRNIICGMVLGAKDPLK